MNTQEVYNKKWEESEKFFQVYRDLYQWLKDKDFERVKSSELLDYNYTLFKDYFDIDHYSNEFFDIDIRFLTHQSEHKIKIYWANSEECEGFLNVLPDIDGTISIDEFKQNLMNLVKYRKEKMLSYINNYDLGV